MQDIFDTLCTQADRTRAIVAAAAQQVRLLTQRLELIVSQNYKKIPIRDESFTAEFAGFCTQLRQQLDHTLDQWHTLRTQLRTAPVKELVPASLQAKSFSLRAKDLSRACDDFTTAYDQFIKVYKKYTLSNKLPVFILTCCCDDLNNMTGKILFLSREVSKKTEKPQGASYAH